jgi:hypothetical protein
MATTREGLIELLKERNADINSVTNTTDVNNALRREAPNAGRTVFGGLGGRALDSLSDQERSRLEFRDFADRSTGARRSNVEVNAGIERRRETNRNNGRIAQLIQEKLDEELTNRAFPAEGGRETSSSPIVRTESGLITNVGNQGGPDTEVLADPLDDFDVTQLPVDQQESIIAITRGLQGNDFTPEQREQAISSIADRRVRRAVEQLIDLDLTSEDERVAAIKNQSIASLFSVSGNDATDPSVDEEVTLGQRIKNILGIQ